MLIWSMLSDLHPLVGRPVLVPADGAFVEVLGLPVHPLVVHAAVVLIPLSALGLITIVVVSRLRRALGWLVLIGLGISAGVAFLAAQSGEALAEFVGVPADHADLGGIMPWLSVALFVVGLLWFLAAGLNKRSRVRAAARSEPTVDASGGQVAAQVPGRHPLVTVLGVASVLLSLLTLGWVAVVGHSGAEAVWGDSLDAPTPAPTASQTSGAASPSATAATGGPTLTSQPATPTATASVTPSTPPATSSTGSSSTRAGEAASSTPPASNSASAPVTFTMAQVAEHDTAADCWAAVGTSVYALTNWIAEHPGGPGPITKMCGTDATAAFRGQHGEDPTPAEALVNYRIGALG